MVLLKKSTQKDINDDKKMCALSRSTNNTSVSKPIRFLGPSFALSNDISDKNDKSDSKIKDDKSTSDKEVLCNKSTSDIKIKDGNKSKINIDDNKSTSINDDSDNKNTLEERFKREFNRIINDTLMIRRIKLNYESRKVDNEVKSPVAFAHLLAYASSSMDNVNTSQSSQSSLSPLYVMDRVDHLIKYCRAAVKCKNALLIFEALARLYLCTTNVILVHKLNKDAFDNLIIQVKEKFQKALVQSGEMIGNIGGQSIGEPCLQMTLNTFHLAGVGAKSMAGGVSKMDELIRVSKDRKKMKSFSSEIYLDSENQTREKAKEVIKYIKPLTLSKFVHEDKCELIWDPDPFNTLIEEDKEMIRDEMFLVEQDEIINLSPIVLRIVLDRNKCNAYGETIDTIFWKLKKLLPKEHMFIKSNINANQWVIRVLLNTGGSEFHKFEKRKLHKNSILTVIKSAVNAGDQINTGSKNSNQIDTTNTDSSIVNELDTAWQVRQMLWNSIVHGISGIVTGIIHKQEKVSYDKNTWEMKNDDEIVITTKGSNFKEIITVPGISATRSYSNNVDEIARTLGIVAAETLFLYEIRRLFSENGSYVNDAHLRTLASAITKSGVPIGFGKNGYHQDTELGWLKRICFERIVKTVVESALSGEVDELINTASNIMLGNPPRIGTNVCTIRENSRVEKERRDIVENNDRIVAQRLMDKLEPSDLIRLIPSLSSDSKFMSRMEKSEDYESFHYESYKKSIMEKNCRYVAPNYATLFGYSSSSNSNSSNSSNSSDSKNNGNSSDIKNNNITNNNDEDDKIIFTYNFPTNYCPYDLISAYKSASIQSISASIQSQSMSASSIADKDIKQEIPQWKSTLLSIEESNDNNQLCFYNYPTNTWPSSIYSIKVKKQENNNNSSSDANNDNSDDNSDDDWNESDNVINKKRKLTERKKDKKEKQERKTRKNKKDSEYEFKRPITNRLFIDDIN